MWHLKTTTVPVIVEALSRIKKERKKHFNKIHDSSSLCEIQQIALCGTVDLFRKVLSMWLKNITQKKQQKHKWFILYRIVRVR